jgi:hypothetical protein
MEFKTQREVEMEAAHTLAGLARDYLSVVARPDVAIEVRTDAGRVPSGLDLCGERAKPVNAGRWHAPASLCQLVGRYG